MLLKAIYKIKKKFLIANCNKFQNNARNKPQN